MSDPFLFFMIAALPVLLIASGFFSGCETALFSLGEHQRRQIARAGNRSLATRALAALLAENRSLLITLLLGNMVINVLFFITSEVALMRLAQQREGGSILWVAAPLIPVLFLIFLGEVVPKLIASRYAVTWSRWSAVPLWLVHRLLVVVRVILNTLVITPLSRLIAPASKPPQLSPEELESLVELSKAGGVIDVSEEALLGEVLALGGRQVRDIMQPRVDMPLFAHVGDPAQLAKQMREHKWQHVLIYDQDEDHIMGMVLARQFLINPPTNRSGLESFVRQVMFVPEIQKLDQLLMQLRKAGMTVAVAVDEFGGTAGLVSLEDVVEQMVGPIVSHDDQPTVPLVQTLGLGRYRVNAALPIHEWQAFFVPPGSSSRDSFMPSHGKAELLRGLSEGVSGDLPGVATLGGLVMARLARLPVVGDEVRLGNLRLVVHEMQGRRIVSLDLYLEKPEQMGKLRGAL